jgi:filamentous hemagglutinin family protein
MNFPLRLLLSAIACLLWTASPPRAQIIPDRSLPENSTVTETDGVRVITGGTRSGDLLFHSFEEFSLPTGGEAFFNQGPDIATILTRVTGTDRSQIDGLIRANGGADLFLLNPNGIRFGPNARLDLGGSFVATSADRLVWDNGSFYSASEANAPPLLTVGVPTGIQFGREPGPIDAAGFGHDLAVQTRPVPTVRGDRPANLAVEPGATLALIGGSVNLSGAILEADNGAIALGAVGRHDRPVRVGMARSDSGLSFDYSAIDNFDAITLRSRALVGVTGDRPGAIDVRGRLLTLEGGSAIFSQNQGGETAPPLQIASRDGVILRGTSSDGIRSSLKSETIASGEGAAIVITGARVRLERQGDVRSNSFDSGKGGDIRIDATQSIFVGSDTRTSTVMTAQTFGSGSGGNLDLAAGTLTVANSGQVSSITFGTGRGGNVQVRTREAVNIDEGILSASTFATGPGGNLAIATGRLSVLKGGRVSATNVAFGNAGSLTVEASEFIEVRGETPALFNTSQIDASSNVLDPFLRELFRLPDRVSGNAGDLQITTPMLRVSDRGSISVKNDGDGNAGTLTLNVERVMLENQGKITGSTQSGEGGDLQVYIGDLLTLRDRSQITTEAGGTGNGGNLTLNSDLLVAEGNSDIVANAFEGAGGQIAIEARGIFGIEFRPRLTSESDITASSQFGISGTVAIDSPEVDASRGTLELPTPLMAGSLQLNYGCVTHGENSFAVVGRGGLPNAPTEAILPQVFWQDLQDFGTDEAAIAPSPQSQVLLKAPREATHWVKRGDRLELVAPRTAPGFVKVPTCF